jgi:protein TonB
MGVYTHSSGNWLTRRGTFLVLLVLFHLALFWALKSGFAVKFLESITAPIKVDIVNEEKKDEPPPPPPPPKMEIPPVEVPPPVVDIQIPVDTPTTALTNITDKPVPPAPPPPPPPRQTVYTALKLNPTATQPNVDDYYPETSRRLEEEGVTKVKVCVGANGRVKTTEVLESSNFSRLDDAALKVAKLLRYTPPTADGKPLDDACAPQSIRFRLPKK